MKRLPSLLPACFLGMVATAQNPVLARPLAERLPPYPQVVTKTDKKQWRLADTSVIGSLKPYLVNPKPGIHRLPQDNMPCIVPDPSATVAIPNLWKGKIKAPFTNGAKPIPNPAKPFRLSPSRPLITTPNEDTK